MNIVLLEPQIPPNTGNIARTCAATGISLHLIEPLGFRVDDKAVKHAGLDYWKDVEVKVYRDIEHFYSENKGRYFYATTKSEQNYCDVNLTGENVYVFFGREDKGLPESLLKDNKDYCIRIPMKDETRSLNLSNAAAIVAYEALRQDNFKFMKIKGQFPK